MISSLVRNLLSSAQCSLTWHPLDVLNHNFIFRRWLMGTVIQHIPEHSIGCSKQGVLSHARRVLNKPVSSWFPDCLGFLSPSFPVKPLAPHHPSFGALPLFILPATVLAGSPLSMGKSAILVQRYMSGRLPASEPQRRIISLPRKTLPEIEQCGIEGFSERRPGTGVSVSKNIVNLAR